jgi:hypothetical protein
MDVNNSFLHVDLLEDIYMDQPQDFLQNSSLVCRLNKFTVLPQEDAYSMVC